MSSSKINPTAASLLGFLHYGPMTGWELDRAVGDSISNFWNVTRSQVYRELRTLTEMGYVQAGERGVRERTPYTITSEGRKAFAAWINQDPGPALIRMPLLLTIFFAEHLPPGRLVEIAARQRQEHAQKLAEFQQVLKQHEQMAPFVAEVVRIGVGYNELMIRTLDRLLEMAAAKPSAHRRPARATASARLRKGEGRKRETGDSGEPGKRQHSALSSKTTRPPKRGSI